MKLYTFPNLFQVFKSHCIQPHNIPCYYVFLTVFSRGILGQILIICFVCSNTSEVDSEEEGRGGQVPPFLAITCFFLQSL